MDRDQLPLPPLAHPQAAAAATPHPVHDRTTPEGESGDSHAIATVESPSSVDRPLLRPGPEGHHASFRPHEDPFEPQVPQPARSRDGHGRTSTRHRAWPSAAGMSLLPRNTSATEQLVILDEKGTKRRTVGERLDPTIKNAEAERRKYASKAMWSGYALNIAIGLQVFFGALTTGLAAAVKNADQARLSTSILGGLATMVASYLARARGSGEPEVSLMRVKDLDHFLRDCRAFQIDHAHEYSNPGDHLDRHVTELRRRLEEFLGNSANGRNNATLEQTPAPVKAA